MEDPRDAPTAGDYALAAAADNARQRERIEQGQHLAVHNRAIKQAQKLIRHEARSMGLVEISYDNWQPDPRARAYFEAANLLEALIEEPMPPKQYNMPDIPREAKG